MDDEDDDFRALFFTECEELLSDLQDHLEELRSGNGDSEALNAAFRAVHSVKGGAAAFGFDALISFAHSFEAVMDLARSDKIELTEPLCQLLLRSSDIMEELIERAREENNEPSEGMERVLGELRAVVDPDGSSEPAPAAAKKDALEEAPKSEEVSDEPALNTINVKFEPISSALRAGHEPLKMLRSAREIGLTKIECIGELAGLRELSFDACTVGWSLTFETEKTQADIEAFFTIYEAVARVEIASDGDPAEAEPEAAAKPESKDAAPVAEVVPPAKKPKAPPKSSAGAKSSKPASKSLRVDLVRVDRLVNLVGEIVITQAALAQRLMETETTLELEVRHSVEAMSRQTRDLQESVMAIRAQPLKSVFSRMPRVVRDLAEKLGKDAILEVTGEQTEVDTTVIEELAEPLTHMLRNAMDHGLEGPAGREEAGKEKTGSIKLSAEHRGERVIIKLVDDGAGINRDAVRSKAVEKGIIGPEDSLSDDEIDQLIFDPGFSTAKEVSSVSGRGVGMDVVKRKILELGGRCTVKSVPGKGCTFTIALPLTLAVLDGMTITVGEERYILPLSNVVEALRLDSIEVHQLPDKSQVLSRRGEYLPLLSIRQVLRIPQQQDAVEGMAIIVDTETEGHVALLVDELIGQRQVVLKSLEANYRRVDGVSGATILGDGRVALILDIPNLVALNKSRGDLFREVVH